MYEYVIMASGLPVQKPLKVSLKFDRKKDGLVMFQPTKIFKPMHYLANLGMAYPSDSYPQMSFSENEAQPQFQWSASWCPFV